MAPDPAWEENPRPFAEARRQLDAYFAGRLEVFDLPLALDGTPFQVKVWRAVAEIPYGQTRAYGDVARRILVAQRGARGGRGQRPESHSHHHSLPPRHRQQWEPHRLWRRAAHQAGAPRPRIAPALARSVTDPIPAPFDRYRARVRPEWIDCNRHLNMGYSWWSSTWPPTPGSERVGIDAATGRSHRVSSSASRRT